LTGDREGFSVSGKLCGFGIRPGSSAKSFSLYYLASTGLNDNCSNLAVDPTKTGTSYGSEFSLNSNVQSDFSGNIFFLVPNGYIFRNFSNSSGFPILIKLCSGNCVSSSVSVTVSIDQSGNIY
jgi:hypothetical protein